MEEEQAGEPGVGKPGLPASARKVLWAWPWPWLAWAGSQSSPQLPCNWPDTLRGLCGAKSMQGVALHRLTSFSRPSPGSKAQRTRQALAGLAG